MTGDLPPHNFDAERGALGSVFIRPQAFPDLAAAVDADDFFLPAHREVFEAMAEVSRRGRPIDVLLVSDELRARNALSRLEGGEGYLITLAGSVPTAENQTHYAGLVRDASTLRKLAMLCAEAQARAMMGQTRGAELTEEISADIAKLVMRRPATLTSIGDLLAERMAVFEQRAEGGVERAISGVRTGVRALDEMTLGFQPKDFVTIAADTGGGKTALAYQAALELTLHQGGTCLFVNLEMPKEQLCERAFVHEAEINSFRLRRGDVSREDYQRLYPTRTKLQPARLYLEDSLSSLREIIARARAWRARHPDLMAMLVVDYIQLVRVPGTRDNRTQQLSDICADLKQLAKDLAITVVVLSQFNRSGSKKLEEEPPTKNDLKDCGSIEQTSDVVLLLWNPQGTEDGATKAILAKNRQGPAREVPLWWTARYYRFTDLAEAPPPPRQQDLPEVA